MTRRCSEKRRQQGLGVLMAGAAAVSAGCAPAALGPAQVYYAEQSRVTDASVRRVTTDWDLRFDDALLLRLREARAAADDPARRDEVLRILGAAADLARETIAGELPRLPDAARTRLAERAGCTPDPAALQNVFSRDIAAAYAVRVQWVARAEAPVLDRYLDDILAHVEDKPGDRGRAWRQALLWWGALPARAGVEATEQRLAEALPARLERTFAAADVYAPAGAVLPGACQTSCYPATSVLIDTLLRFAPVIVQERAVDPVHDAACDDFGRVHLAGVMPSPEVRIDGASPAVYAYSSRARIHGQWYEQAVYVWWYPRRPEIARDDPAAGPIDGVTLRITLDARGRPAIFEALQACGCGHLVFIAEDVERAARQGHEPVEGASFAVQRNARGPRHLIVAGTVAVAEGGQPTVYVEAGYHSITRIEVAAASPVVGPAPRRPYDLLPYSALDRLPLGGGVASMFGADGLVHGAGRPEGYLLAPTGMLSAGQPRKRGTQKIRWDAYDFDDPQLLDALLDLPSGF